MNLFGGKFDDVTSHHKSEAGVFNLPLVTLRRVGGNACVGLVNGIITSKAYL